MNCEHVFDGNEDSIMMELCSKCLNLKVHIEIARLETENARLREVIQRYLNRAEYDWDEQFKQALKHY
jgi:predicted  nucleic acid-binding Zn-ribbon protein